MGRKNIPGLFKRGGVWHIDKKLFGQRVCESTGTGSLIEAENYLARKIDQLRNASIFGVRPDRTFRDAALRYLKTNMDNSSIDTDALHVSQLDKYIGKLPLSAIHDGTLLSFIEARKKEGRKNKTINLGLEVVRKILNLAASKWRDESGLTWLATPPKISMLSLSDSRKPYPLSWEEQARFFEKLPLHLRRMALFKVNTGCREQEVCQLRWDWEIKLPELNTSVFIIPAFMELKLSNGQIERVQLVKNGEDRLVVLNQIARSVIEEVRGMDSEFVFTYEYKKGYRRSVQVMNNTAWQRTRLEVGLPQVRVHDLKHTFGQRLRAAGVSAEDRKDLLGHKSREITTHYSAAEVSNLIKAAETVCNRNEGATLTVLKLNNRLIDSSTFSSSRKTPASFAVVQKVINETLHN